MSVRAQIAEVIFIHLAAFVIFLVVGLCWLFL